MKYFSDSVPFRKANFHCHTTESDGRLTPAECMALYRKAGYEILAITDHKRVTDPGKAPDGLLMIPGTELDFQLPGQWVHLIGLGMNERIAAEWDRNGTPQQAVNDILRLGGVALLAHPAWSLNTPDFIASLKGVCGAEIWNSVSTVPHNADRADSSSLLDVAWASGASLLPVFANDDSHFYDSEATVAATMVQTGELTETAVLDALKNGRFYATLGPQIRQIETDGYTLTVHCSEAETVIFYSNMPWVSDRTVTGRKITEATYVISPGDRYVRVEVRDAAGRKAWSAPVPVN